MIPHFRLPNIRRPILAFLMVCCAALQPVGAHDVSHSVARIDWNAGARSIEVVLDLHGHELERALSRRVGRQLSFLEEADIPALEAAAGPLLDQAITLSLDDTLVELIYIGLETNGQATALYLEASWPSAPKRVSFMNRLFIEDVPGQVHTVIAVVGGKRLGGDIRNGSGPVVMEF